MATFPALHRAMLVSALNWHDQCERPLAMWLALYGLLGLALPRAEDRALLVWPHVASARAGQALAEHTATGQRLGEWGGGRA